MITRHVVEIAGSELQLLSRGLDATAAAGVAPLVLLHQVPSSSWMWRRVIEALPAGLPVIAPDLPGYGESAAPQSTPSMESLASLTLAGVAAVHPGPWVLAGHHTGALLGLVALDADPERCLGVMGLGLPYFPDWQQRFRRFERLTPLDPGRDPGQLQAYWEFTSNAFEADTPLPVRLRALADRLVAGPCWYHGYVALYGYDARALACRLRARRQRIELTRHEHDALSACSADILADFEIEPEALPGGPWVTVEHPALIAERLLGFHARMTGVAA
jgi:pimeloyl-ACP methyl ester carboxylesterase